MARPERKDADYFPFYAKDGRTLHILEGKYECKGTGFFTNVMRFLTLEDNHHFCIADESDLLYFFSKCKCDKESGMDMLNIMSKTGKIHSALWVSYKVIASQDLFNSLKDAYRNRNNDIITIDEIWVSYNGKPQESDVSCAGNSQEGKVSDTENPQRKGKETKGKKKRKFNQKDFDLFYSRFPNKKEKKAAESRWRVLLKSGELPEIGIILNAIKKQIAWRSTANGEFRPEWKNPATWLNKGCWDDEAPSIAEPERQSLKMTCSAGPCQKPVKKKGDYCKDCQEVLVDANCTTYEQFVGDIDKIKKLTEGIG